jgi:phosphoglucomutase/phosphomannomutase
MGVAGETLSQVTEALRERYGRPGADAADLLRTWLSGEVPLACPETIEKHLDTDRTPLLFDAFWRILPFGTSGRRGPVGYGPNRINPTTVATTVQGHCNYLKDKFGQRTPLTVVVANDVRVFRDLAGTYAFLGEDHPLLGISSRSLARLACEIYAANGITACFAAPEEDEAVLTTPMLSYAISTLGAAGGINISASHNPPDDNGLKVYDQNGAQPVPPEDQRLADRINAATEVHRRGFDEALAAGAIRALPETLTSDYIREYKTLYAGVWSPDPSVPITYTPLCGSGFSTVGTALGEIGFPLLTPPQEGPDGRFEAIPFRAPNPEVADATLPARAFADANGAEIVLSSDPDADRIGVDAKLPDGTWYHFDGHQIAAILCYFLMLDPHGPKRRGLVVETVVTTRLLRAIAQQAGDSWVVDDLLVGFKYIAEVLRTLDEEGAYGSIRCAPGDLVMAAEEAHGVILLAAIRDKDATPAALFLAALHQRLRTESRTLFDYYGEILRAVGPYDCVNRSIMLRGAEGLTKKNEMMASLRASPPAEILGRKVTEFVDYLDEARFGPYKSETDKVSRDVVTISTEVCDLIVRPSGTEPKLKFYCHLLPGAHEPAEAGPLFERIRAQSRRLASAVYRELLGRIDVSISDAALRLPDIVDLDSKLDFDQRLVPDVRTALAEGSYRSVDEVLDALRERAAGMIPGADPLPALKAPLAELCDEWEEAFGSTPLLSDLRIWTKP